MSVTSFNRALRAHVAPLLRHAGFQRVEARRAWSQHTDHIRVVHIQAVGAYFRDVTGWPAGSVHVEVGVRFSDEPDYPAMPSSHLREALFGARNPTDRLMTLSNPAERARTDIWWVEPDGGNADAVAQDVARALTEQGLPWLESAGDPRRALAMVESHRDCLVKYELAALLASRLGEVALYERYRILAQTEAARLQRG